VYCDARGGLARFAKAVCDQAVIALRRGDDTVEVIPVAAPKVVAVSLDGRDANAVALDRAAEPVGPAETRFSRGLVHVLPVSGAFSYLLTPTDRPATALQCDRLDVVAGETVTVEGKRRQRFRVPPAARPGGLLWHKAEEGWIDFVVRPLAAADLAVADGRLRLRLRSRLARETEFSVRLLGSQRTRSLPPEEPADIHFALPKLKEQQVLPAELELAAGQLSMRKKWWLEAKRGFRRLAELPSQFEAGQRFRGKQEGPLTAGSIASVRKDMTCGGVRKSGLFMHPPWQGGVGYSYALYGPVVLPADAPAAFRCSIGKGDGSDPGDGILFRLAVVDGKGDEKVLAERQWLRHAWGEMTADLSKWTGQRVRIKLIADVGPKDNSSGDWACWADLRIESAGPVVEIAVHDAPPSRAEQKGRKP
ncbi:MAG: hypothetical protein WBF17_08360, partial [Phycisphaerae bacterium]